MIERRSNNHTFCSLWSLFIFFSFTLSVIADPDPIHNLAKNSNFKKLKAYLKKYPDKVNVKNERFQNYTPLHYAASYDKIANLRFLIDEGADVNALTSFNENPLALAAAHGNSTIFSILLTKTKNPLLVNKQGWTLLHHAASGGNILIIEKVLKLSNDIQLKDSQGRTALLVAADFGKLEALKYLQSKGAKLDATDKFDQHALIKSAKGGHLENCKYLITQRLDTNHLDSSKRTALHYAAARGNHAIVKLLLANGAKPDIRDEAGNNPLLSALKTIEEHGHKHAKDHLEIVNQMLGKVDINHRNQAGESLLSLAVSIDNLELCKELLKHDAKINALKNQDTLLHLVQSKEIAALLAGHCPLNARNAVGETPLQHAIRNSNMDIVKFLMAKDVEINTRNNAFDTPLHTAAFKLNIPVVKMLLEKGANKNQKNMRGQYPYFWAQFYKNKKLMALLKPETM